MNLKGLTELKAYECVEHKKIEDLNSEGYVLRHKKTGARVALISNDDENKVFSISFRTPPEDSTGTPHIVEHTVLCGSKEFPVKDPFIELAKGSLNTFLNAMTFPDKTMYPVASCNDKDFQNLMHVYLDAVFYPNIYKEEKIFRQEGWHYECEDESAPIELNGVVYSEMKGAFSSAEDVIDREIRSSLFPDTPYGVESGGDPQVIPKLTYEAFLDFHRRYYHPSNSYIYLYGNMDMAEKLTFIDEHYLSHFENQPIDSKISLQKPFEEAKDIRIEYPIAEEEEEEDNTFLTFNAVMGESVDRELYVALQVLDYAICSAPGAPLKKALIDKGIGKDVYSTFENGIRQSFFSVVARNANESQKEEFLSTIREVLEGIVKDGFNQKSLLGALNYYEFRYREADFGSYPKGLMYGMQIMDSWLYDDKLVFWHIEQNETFAILKKKVKEGYFEGLIQKYLLDNPHRATVIAVPKKGLTSEREEALKEELKAYKDSLTKDEIKEIVEATRALKEYQESEDEPELLAKIPLLSREDINKEPFLPKTEKGQIGAYELLAHDYFTNGIGYLSLLFPLDGIPMKSLKYLGLMNLCLGYMDTSKKTYGDLFDETSLYTGGITLRHDIFFDEKNPKSMKSFCTVSMKVLYENLKKGLELMEETVFDTVFEDEKRFKEIVSETKSRIQASFISSGHTIAMNRALSYISPSKALLQITEGMEFYQLLCNILDDFDTEGKKAIQELNHLRRLIFRAGNMIVDYTSPAGREAELEGKLDVFAERLYKEELTKEELAIPLHKSNEAFKTSAQIQYVCRGGNFRNKGLKYTSRLRLLKIILGYDYLWNNIRVKGGAYGCMTRFERNGDAGFVSYRDPNLTKTVEVFESVTDYLNSFEADERTMTQFIIGAISNEDTPLPPRTKGMKSLTLYLSNISDEERRKERLDILNTMPEDVRALAEYMEAFLADECICVVGGERAIEEAADLFGTIKTLV